MTRLLLLWRLIKGLGPVCYLMADAFAYGARLYGNGTWREMSPGDHLEMAVLNIIDWKTGETAKPVLVDALLRVAFAVYLAIQKGTHPAEYEKHEA